MRTFKRILFHSLFTTFLALVTSVAFGQPKIPDLWGLRVHDDAHILSTNYVTSLEQKLAAYEDSTSNQIAVLTIPTLDGTPIEEFSLSVVEQWKLGQKGKDNGALLLIAVEDHQMRIETGYGLEGVLPDATCSEIIRNEIAPNFRRNDFDAGVDAGITAMIQAIGGEYTASGDANNGNGFERMTWKEQALVSLFVFGILGLFTFLGLASKGRVAWFLYIFLIPFYAAFPSALFGWAVGRYILMGYLGGYLLLKLWVFRNKDLIKWQSRGGGRGWSSGSGWMGGGGWGGGGGFSGGGGGFSGGGGGFGGGGASGSW